MIMHYYPAFYGDGSSVTKPKSDFAGVRLQSGHDQNDATVSQFIVTLFNRA